MKFPLPLQAILATLGREPFKATKKILKNGGASDRRDFLSALFEVVDGSVALSALSVKARQKINYSQESDLVNGVESLWEQLYNKSFFVSKEAIEREINKWEPWTLDFIYDVSFVYDKKSTFSGAYKPYEHKIIAPYNHLSKRDLTWFLVGLDIPQDYHNNLVQEIDIENPEKRINWNKFNTNVLTKIKERLIDYKSNIENQIREFADAFDHELSHVLIDNKKGLRTSPFYSGPNDKEIKQNVIRLLSSKKHRENLTRIYQRYLGETYYGVRGKYGSLENFIMSDFSASQERFKDYEAIFDKNIDAIVQPYSTIIDATNDDSNIRLHHEKAEDQEEQNFFGALGKLNFSTLKKKYLVLFNKYDEKGKEVEEYYFKDLPYIHIRKEKLGKYVYYNVLRSHTEKNMHKYGVPLNDLGEFAVYLTEKKSMNSIVHETNARIIDSLLNVYFGSTTLNNWELDEHDIEFLGLYKYKGDLVFRKNLEKYQVGMQMRKQGTDQKVIREALEYATHFNFNKRDYSWPENGFRFLKQIPIVNTMD